MTHRWGILGGGFGLYGYVPAIASNPLWRVIILEKHRDFIYRRPELRKFLNIIDFVPKKNEILLDADSLIISLPPMFQTTLFSEVEHKRYRNLMLEKPLAVTPDIGIQVLKSAIALSDSVRVGYSFFDTAWGADIVQKILNLNSQDDISIVWDFQAHHFRVQDRSWKADHDKGGGVLRFYGIQLIALIARVDGVKINSSILINEESRGYCIWLSEFLNKKGAKVKVSINCNASNQKFEIIVSQNKRINRVSLKSPFDGQPVNFDDDKRCSVLKTILNTFQEDNHEYYSLYKVVNELWYSVERDTKVMQIV